jgi:tRNA A37 threonylcarbamoyladenosine modification protein TsaB
MRILALETSGRDASLAVLEGDDVENRGQRPARLLNFAPPSGKEEQSG